MTAVKLLLKERLNEKDVFLLDLFGASLNIEDKDGGSSAIAGVQPLSTTHLLVNFKGGVGFPSRGEELEVLVTVTLLSGKLAAFENVNIPAPPGKTSKAACSRHAVSGSVRTRGAWS